MPKAPVGFYRLAGPESQARNFLRFTSASSRRLNRSMHAFRQNWWAPQR